MCKNLLVNTTSGAVRGICEDGFLSFKGIPYASAPRFQPPQPVSWDGELSCVAYGKAAMQSSLLPPPIQAGSDSDNDASSTGGPQAGPAPTLKREDFDEDCLNLNIYIPEGTPPDAGLPVLVEVHGGGMQSGSNQQHTPSVMLKHHAAIYISINYRLGVWGFLYLKDVLGEAYATSGNTAVLDVMAALRWIHSNISSFGGDSDRITVLGGSAGAKLTSAMMLIPEFDDYVAQVILSSGAQQCVRSLRTAGAITQQFLSSAARVMGEDWDPKQLLTISADELLNLQNAMGLGGSVNSFGPVADGIVIPIEWETIAEQGTFWNGNAMIGCSRNEMSMLPMASDGDMRRAGRLAAEGAYGKNAVYACRAFEALEEQYIRQNGMEMDAAAVKKSWIRIMSDFQYRTFSYRLAERLSRKGCHVWQYSVELAPACHCTDISLAFGLPGELPPFMREGVSGDAQQQFAQAAHDSFLYFVTHGSLGQAGDPAPDLPQSLWDWLPLDPTNPKLMYWDVESEVRSMPEDDVLHDFPDSALSL